MRNLCRHRHAARLFRVVTYHFGRTFISTQQIFAYRRRHDFAKRELPRDLAVFVQHADAGELTRVPARALICIWRISNARPDC